VLVGKIKLPEKKMVTHVDRTTTPFTGVVKVDATAVAPLLVDLSQGSMKGLRTAGAGIADVLAELAAAMPGDGAAAGISPATYQAVVTNTANIAQLEPLQQQVQKLAEVLTETLALQQNAREQALGQIADAIHSAEKRTKSKGVAAPFQKTLAYTSASGVKAAKTREENKAAKAAAAAAPAAPAAPAAGH
jgi:hypothetical protein